MAGKSSKKQAGRNEALLKRLHLIVGVVVVAAILRRWVSGKGHWMRFIMMNMGMFWSEYVLEKSGRPVYDKESGKLVKEGTDLSQEGGLTEYLFDLVYLSVIANAGTALLGTDKVWLLMLLCPAYAGYKLYSMFGKKGGIGIGQRTREEAEVEVKSKRQLKREKRGDKVQMKYR